MMTQSKPIFNSVLLLTITMVIVKSLSAIYRVPYQKKSQRNSGGR